MPASQLVALTTADAAADADRGRVHEPPHQRRDALAPSTGCSGRRGAPCPTPSSRRPCPSRRRARARADVSARDRISSRPSTQADRRAVVPPLVVGPLEQAADHREPAVAAVGPDGLRAARPRTSARAAWTRRPRSRRHPRESALETPSHSRSSSWPASSKPAPSSHGPAAGDQPARRTGSARRAAGRSSRPRRPCRPSAIVSLQHRPDPLRPVAVVPVAGEERPGRRGVTAWFAATTKPSGGSTTPPASAPGRRSPASRTGCPSRAAARRRRLGRAAGHVGAHRDAPGAW